ncbi:MAG: hypothetical protein ABWZ42_09090 [Ilumatobacteraceae bacterium]
MTAIRKLLGRLRGDDVAALRLEVAELHELVLHLNHLLSELNHDVRAGAEERLPLFLGYAERFRTDADTMIGATEILDRQLRRLEHGGAPIEADRAAAPDG